MEEGDENRYESVAGNPELQKAVKAWVDYQDGQRILLTTPTVLVGYRVEVYRAEGTTQWYTAVIQSYNPTTKSLTLTDDTVLEEHNEEPALIQMRLIDNGVHNKPFLLFFVLKQAGKVKDLTLAQK
nr:hypothetical protein BaRGS_025772 [Batillaria attramentaria]